MNLRDELFELWAPTGGPWSDWAKPVLFAHTPAHWQHPAAELMHNLPDVRWAPRADGSTAIVVDLPGAASVRTGVALAEVGYRPVPLFNAVPGPQDNLPLGVGRATVDAWSIVYALVQVESLMRAIAPSLALDAPPAFLLDSERRFGRFVAQPSDFDNRSVSLPTDFPSSNLMLSRGTTRVLLVMHGTTQPQEDLAHTLRRWQDAGIQIQTCDMAAPTGADVQTIDVAKPIWYRQMWSNLLAVMGMRRSPLGGFGGTLPEPSSG